MYICEGSIFGVALYIFDPHPFVLLFAIRHATRAPPWRVALGGSRRGALAERTRRPKGFLCDPCLVAPKDDLT